ncbi:MAG: biopolymer transporter ExbD [Bdellovibrionales bacterium]|nr:biopolymer transporter ExbD [Bdellovibrionales bacterium]
MGRKAVNVELNMTPFIGLFALLVVNLLLTAVWNQVTALSTNTQNSTAAAESDPPPKDQVNLTVTILQSSVEMAENSNGVKVPHIGDKVDAEGIERTLSQWREKYPKRRDVVLNTENGVSYKMLITTFDTLTGAGWYDVGVSSQ